jgi:hypothetical protein
MTVKGFGELSENKKLSIGIKGNWIIAEQREEYDRCLSEFANQSLVNENFISVVSPWYENLSNTPLLIPPPQQKLSLHLPRYQTSCVPNENMICVATPRGGRERERKRVSK